MQWIQLYEIDASLIGSVLGALGEVFADYAVYAPSDHDILIIAGDALPAAPQARVFEQPGLARELWTIHALAIGDIDARYIGRRATLEPLFASYAMPANSDYFPVLDLNAERGATEVVALGALGVPVLDFLEPSRPRRPPNPLYQGAYAFERLENTRLAWYARNYLLTASAPQPQGVPRWLQKDLELLQLRLFECRSPRDEDVWLHSFLRLAQVMIPYLAWDDLAPLWERIARLPCASSLHEFQRQWITVFRALAARDAARTARLAQALLGSQTDAGSEAREFLLTAGMAGYVASGDAASALALWKGHASQLRKRDSAVFRLLRCHARRADCADEFASR